MGFSEMRRPGEWIEEMNDYIMFYKGEHTGQKGVGLATIPEVTKAKENKVDEVPEILASEVIKAIKFQKLKKAPGPDKIPNKMIKGTLEETSPVLAKLFNKILQTREIPEEWTECHIILLHKKDLRDEIEDYRPISLITNMCKVFAKVILEGISSILSESQPVEEAGSRKDFSTIDHIHTIKQLIQMYNKCNKQIYLAFIDYSKEFDSLRHQYIWRSLEQQGVQNYIEILKSIYKSSKVSIKLESTGESFPIKKGVCQGDPLSPTLFNAVLEYIFRQLNWDHLGLNINGAHLNHLRFADDLVLLEGDLAAIEKMMQSLANKSREVGLKINANKTKLMTNSRETDVMLDGNKIEYVKEYIYLEQIISPSDEMTKLINRRIAQGWRKYWSLKEIVKSKDLGNHIKKETFETCFLPVFNYGCEIWSITLHHRERLAKCQRAMERSMLGLKTKDRIDIRTRTQLTDILTRIDVQKW
ncbi:LINE-1 retrotransposable element ORF2 protein [Eumeta japonica]|uniref:LINE-1 retrotransposable element ORF2 protein n=1 Tax=Eumeta variegata TaxID=151549 RepID=A0A4C1XL32_EUMVA|nr:LINE-1 retrotransposable element ORF2 protein [Eumeta japonica]